MTARMEAALVWAARFGHGIAVELLIGAKVNVEAKDTGGYGRGADECEHLVGRSSPPPVPSGVCGSATALMSAAAAGHVEIIAALLAADAKPDATNDYGCGPRLGRRVSVGCCSRLCCRGTAFMTASLNGQRTRGRAAHSGRRRRRVQDQRRVRAVYRT